MRRGKSAKRKVDDAVELRKRCKIRTGQVVEFNGSKVVVQK